MTDATPMPNMEEALARIKARHSGGNGSGPTSNDMDDKTEVRLRQAEIDIGSVKSGLEWAKTYAGVWMAIVLAGFSILFAIVLNTNSKVDGLSSKLSEEFRAQRQDLNAQTSAIATAITAAKEHGNSSTNANSAKER